MPDDALVRYLVEENRQLKEAGNALFKRYTMLVDSGDAGFWDWSDEEECQKWLELTGGRK